MGRRVRPLPGVDRAGLDGKPVGLQRHGGHHFDRRLFVVHLFHSTENGLKRISYIVGSADTWPPEWPARSHSFGHDITSSRSLFGRLNRLLGYVIAIVAIAMLLHAIRPQP